MGTDLGWCRACSSKALGRIEPRSVGSIPTRPRHPAREPRLSPPRTMIPPLAPKPMATFPPPEAMEPQRTLAEGGPATTIPRSAAHELNLSSNPRHHPRWRGYLKKVNLLSHHKL